MKIRKLTYENLHGYLSNTIEFDNSINLLVGINGSGKTSILKLLFWILKPDIPRLAACQFSSIKLDLDVDGKDTTIYCKKTVRLLEIHLQHGNEEFTPLKVRLLKEIHQREMTEEQLIDRYSNLRAEGEEFKTLEFLEGRIQDVLELGVDRYFFAKQLFRYSETNIETEIGNRDFKPERSALDRVEDLINSAFRQTHNRVNDLSAKFRDEVLLSMFTNPVRNSATKLEEIPKLKIEKIRNWLSDYFQNKNQKNPQVQESINTFFQDLDRIQMEYNDNENDVERTVSYFLNFAYFNNLSKSVSEYEEYESKKKALLEADEKFLETVNSFLDDSAKQIRFDDKDSSIKVNVIGKNGKVKNSLKKFSSLSSGEKQLLMLLGFIRYGRPSGHVFLVDEPELSLHPKWQESFYSAIEKILPPGSQIVLATHSPNIVGPNREKCILLSPI